MGHPRAHVCMSNTEVIQGMYPHYGGLSEKLGGALLYHGQDDLGPRSLSITEITLYQQNNRVISWNVVV